MRQVEEKQFDVSGLTLAARFWPGEGTPILALHGYQDNANSFAPLAAHLPNPLLALDFAGHGHSAHRPLSARLSFLDYVEDVCDLAPQLGWEKFILMGHSMGAGVASLVAASGLLPLTELWLIDALGPMAAKSEAAGSNFVSAMVEHHKPRRPPSIYADVDAAAQKRTQGFGGLSIEASRLFAERGLERVEGGYRWAGDARLRLPSLVYMEEGQVNSILHRVKVPSLLIRAKDGIGGKGILDNRIGHVRDLAVVDLEGPHHLHMEQPAPVAAALLAFTHGVSARVAS